MPEKGKRELDFDICEAVTRHPNIPAGVMSEKAMEGSGTFISAGD